MNYYWIRYTDELPEKFGGLASGPLIRIRPQYKDDRGLLEHEKTHVRQWFALTGLGLLLAVSLMLLVSPAIWPVVGSAPFLHSLLYRFVKPYRQWCEVKAYRKQLEVGGYASSNFAVTALVDKYDLNLNATEAAALLHT